MTHYPSFIDGGRRGLFLYYLLLCFSFKWVHLRQRIAFEREIHARKMSNEIRKVSQETEQYVRSAEIAERLEMKGRVSNNAAPPGKIRQRLTEEQIQHQKLHKKIKNEKYLEILKKNKEKKLKSNKLKPKSVPLNLFGTN